jgi:hypothetical protein
VTAVSIGDRLGRIPSGGDRGIAKLLAFPAQFLNLRVNCLYVCLKFVHLITVVFGYLSILTQTNKVLHIINKESSFFRDAQLPIANYQLPITKYRLLIEFFKLLALAPST